MKLLDLVTGGIAASIVFPGVRAWTQPMIPIKQSFNTGSRQCRRIPCMIPESSSCLSVTTTMDDDVMLSSAPFIVGFALVIGIAAQGWINNMIGGDRGLGAYLSDGRGFAGSRFSPEGGSGDAVSGNDPLPWLTLPTLEFVEVAGQSDPVEVRLETLRLKMNRALQEGKVQQAVELRQELEEIMSANGFDYTAEEWQ